MSVGESGAMFTLAAMRARQSMIGFRRRRNIMAERKPTVAIVGGGLVGALAACFFARRGFNVCVYEYRTDIRVEESRGQSIDLALSCRGREALRAVGLENALIDNHGIPMRGRMIHGTDGQLKEILYDNIHGNCIYSVSRRHLNVVLLNAAEGYTNVKLRFNMKLVDAQLDDGKMKFLNTKTRRLEDTSAELIVGADGAYSAVRRLMLKRPRFDCSQTYIEHGYTELFVPAAPQNNFAMSGEHLHIWPRGDFMMIALPNDDRTFTCNLFAPFATFARLREPDELLEFCAQHFPDLLQLVGERRIVADFFASEPKALISIKCKPYHVGKTALLLGDAAHAMVPFYAQGMNAGFEDLLILDELMELHNADFSKVLPSFSERRCNDAHAICELAMYNYLEMRDLVTRKSFIVRKHLDNFLHRLLPKTWLPLYHTVHFSRMSFRQCMTNKNWQDKVIRRSLWCIGIVVLAVLSVPYVRKF